MTLTLLHPWAWWLSIRGVEVYSGRSRAFSAMFALVPIVLFYATWGVLSFTLFAFSGRPA